MTVDFNFSPMSPWISTMRFHKWASCSWKDNFRSLLLRIKWNSLLHCIEESGWYSDSKNYILWWINSKEVCLSINGLRTWTSVLTLKDLNALIRWFHLGFIFLCQCWNLPFSDKILSIVLMMNSMTNSPISLASFIITSSDRVIYLHSLDLTLC